MTLLIGSSVNWDPQFSYLRALSLALENQYLIMDSAPNQSHLSGTWLRGQLVDS